MLEDMVAPDSRRPCKVRTIMNGLEESDQKILQKAINDEVAWKDAHLAKALVARGIQVGEGAFRKHRRQECSCR